MPKSLKHYKDKNKMKEYRRRHKLKNYAMSRPIKEFRYWSIEELEMLSTFKGTDRELGRIISRSVQAIQVKRYNLKKEDN